MLSENYPMENPPSQNSLAEYSFSPNSPVVNYPAEYSPEETFTAKNYPVFINAFFIHYSLKMKNELIIA